MSRNESSSNHGPLTVAGFEVPPGQRRDAAIPVARLPSQGWLELPVALVHGARPGPRIWLSAAVHGDELNGIEVVRQTLASLDPSSMAGTVIGVPVVNVFGLYSKSRYTPDRRDLNRMFPGSSRGTIAARLAHLFLKEIVTGCELGVDLHTGSDHRTNVPQLRYDFRDERMRGPATAWGAGLTVHKVPKKGTLRGAAAELGVPVLLWEAGEPLRYEAAAIESGVAGLRRMLAHLGMIDDGPPPAPPTTRLEQTRWIRAPRGGLFRSEVVAGQRVTKGEILGRIGDPLEVPGQPVRSPRDGVVIGLALGPVVFQGDLLAHLGW